MVYICRLCSKYELNSTGLTIFGEIGTKRSLAYKIKLTVDVVVSHDDPLPKYVCKCCLGKLEETFSFQESCRRAQLQLRDYFLRGSAELVENGDISFEDVCDNSGISSETSVCDTTGLSTPTELEPSVLRKCQELGPNNRISMLNSVESSSHILEAEQANALDPEITAVSANADSSLLTYTGSNNSTSHCILRNDTIVQHNSVVHSSELETQDSTGVDDSALEICIKEEEVDLGCDYYEPEGNVYINSKDVNNRLQSVITNALPTKLKAINTHADPAVLEASKAVEIVVTEETLNSSDVLSGETNPICQDPVPGKSQGNKDDDIYVVEIVKANKTSVAQYWERYESHFRCKKCLKVFLRKGKCENHIRTHLGVKPYECHICKHRFRKKRLLNEHSFVHSGKKLYHCVFCSKAFRFKNNFQKHTKNHPEPRQANLMCDRCGKVFNSQWKYWQHKASKHLLVSADIEVE